MLHLGIDIGGTKMEAVLLDPAGECVQRLRRPTHKESYDAFMRQLLTLIADIRAVSPQPFTLGIGLPGAIDPQSGRIKNCNCLVLNGHDLRRDIMQQLGQPVWMANDADCFTLSEAVDGAGAGATTVFGVIIGTGCGGGIAVHQQLLSGPNLSPGSGGIIRCRAILLSAMARRSPATAAKRTASKAFSPVPASPAAMGNKPVRKPLSPRRKTAIRARWPTGDTLSMPLPAAWRR